MLQGRIEVVRKLILEGHRPYAYPLILQTKFDAQLFQKNSCEIN